MLNAPYIRKTDYHTAESQVNGGDSFFVGLRCDKWSFSTRSKDRSMDFRLSAEEENLRQSVEAFVRDELLPLEPEFENAPDIFEGSRWKSRAKLSTDPEVQRYIAIMENLEKKAATRGLWYLDVPREYGGEQVSNVGMIAITEELEKTSIPFELGNHVSNILYNCKGEQIDRFLLPCIRGEKTSAFGLSEPASGV